MQPDTPARSSSPDLQSAEARILGELKRHVGAKDYRHWFQGKTVVRLAGDELIVGVGSPFLLNWMQKHFRRETTAAARAVAGPSAVVRFTVEVRPPDASPPAATDGNSVRSEAASKTPAAGPPNKSPVSNSNGSASNSNGGRKRSGRRFSDLNDFVPGETNDMPLLAAMQVCGSPGDRYNPLFLHGNIGCGKTHLLEGIYRKFRQADPTLKTVYLTAEAFTNYFTQALRKHALPGFRERFRTVDVLLIDDVDFLEGKTATQEEFLHTFDQLVRGGRQVVVASDRHPRLLEKICEELATRFVSGLTCRVQVPNLEGRLEILRRKAAQMKARIQPEAMQYVAARFGNNVRELIGALHCLANQHEMTGKPVSVAAAKRVLADLERDCLRMIGIPDVERAVCDFFRVTPKDLKSPKRSRSVSQPRMLAMFLMRKHTGAAYSEIGEHFGGRNHATVISAEKRVRGWINDGESVQVASEQWPLSEVVAVIEQKLAG